MQQRNRQPSSDPRKAHLTEQEKAWWQWHLQQKEADRVQDELNPGRVHAERQEAHREEEERRLAKQRQDEQRHAEERQAQRRTREQQEMEEREAKQRKAEQLQAEKRQAEQRKEEEERQADRRRMEQALAERRQVESQLDLRRVDSLIAEHNALMALWGSSRQAAQTRLVLKSGVMAGMLAVCVDAQFQRHRVALCCFGLLMNLYWLVSSIRSHHAMGVRLKHGRTLELHLALALGKPELAFPNPMGWSAKKFKRLQQGDLQRESFDRRRTELQAGHGTPQFFTELELRPSCGKALRDIAEMPLDPDGFWKACKGQLLGLLAMPFLYFYTLPPLMCMGAWAFVMCFSLNGGQL